jgi:hypothetical protein
MLLEKYISSYSAVTGVMAPEYEGMLITISVLVVIAALVFAGYIFTRNDNQRIVSGDAAAEARESGLRNIDGRKKAGVTARDEKELHPDINTPVPLRISELEVAPLEVRIGEKVTISFTAANLDKSRSHFGIILKIDNRMLATQEISVEPGSTLPGHFIIYSTVPGEHLVEVNDVVSKFYVDTNK